MTLLEKIRRGMPVTDADKVADIRSVEELDGFIAQHRLQGTWSGELSRLTIERRAYLRPGTRA